MAFITLAGTLRDPTSELAVGDQIRFTHKSTTGETVEGAVSVLTIDPSGTYSKDLQYGLVLVEYKDVRTSQFKNLGVATVNGSNPATSIPELLNALVPVSSAELIEFQAILADAITARNEAEAFAASIDLINDLSQAYIFDTVAEFKASLIEFPDGKTIHLNDRDADFTKITGNTTTIDGRVVFSTNVDQSIELIVNAETNQKQFGVFGLGYPNSEGALLNEYANYCRDNKRELILSDNGGRSIIYTTEQINFQDINVSGNLQASIDFGAVPSAMNFNLLSGIPGPRPSAATVYVDEERLPLSGICIFSDTVDKIVLITPRFLYSGFGVSGYLELAGQNCIATPASPSGAYVGASFPLNNISVSGSGGDGISLPNGIEVCAWYNIKSNQNNGYGATTAGGGGDGNQEYFTCYNSEFRLNRLDGFLMGDFRKNVEFEFCNSNSNGWYGLGSNAVSKPSDVRFIRGLLRVEGVQTFGASNLKMTNCYSEDCARLATFELDNPLSGLGLTGSYVIPTLGLTDATNDLFYFYGNGTSQLRNLVIKGNAIQNGARGKVFNGDVAESNFISAEIGYLQTTDYDLALINRFIANAQSFKKQAVFSEHIKIAEEDIGDGTAGTFTSNYVANHLRDAGQGNNSFSNGTCYLVTANWQATNSDNGGAYLVYAFKTAVGNVKGESMVFGAGVGFTSAPTVASNGVLSVQLNANYRSQITRIDMNGFKA